MQPNDPQPSLPEEQPQAYAAPVPPVPQQFQDQSQPVLQPDPTPVQQFEPQPTSIQEPAQPTPAVAPVQFQQPPAPLAPEPAPSVNMQQAQLYSPPEQPAPFEQPAVQPVPTVNEVQPQPMVQSTDVEPMQPAEPQPVNVDQPTQLTAVAPVSWQAKEYLQQDKPPLWYVLFAIVVVVFVGVALWLQAWTFAVLVPIMAAALAVYAHRPPRIVTYSVSEKGLTINDQLHPMGEFKSFGVLPDSELHSLMLVPVKRFRPGVTLYFPEEVGEPLVDMLGAYLPMQDLHVDMVDKVIHKLRI